MQKLNAITVDCVWGALENDPDTAADLRARAALIHILREVFESAQWQEKSVAAAHRVLSRVRIHAVLRGDINRLPLATLRQMVAIAIPDSSGDA